MSKDVTLLTKRPAGHTLHHNGVFSPDGQWVVFDGRNDDTKIGETATIGVVNLISGEEKVIYETTEPTVHGPGVGAASFSPSENTVIFIHGLSNADANKPYAITRRTGVAIRLEEPHQPLMMDARDITPPYASGSLRGGTHSHMWSPDGQMVSFTYNDEEVDPDLRVVGVMVPHAQGVRVDEVPGNTSGRYFSAIVSQVVRNPTPGSDQINKAFDECWLGRLPNGGTHVLAFQGNVVDQQGRERTEVFLVEVDPQKLVADTTAVGSVGERPRVPEGIRQRRLTFTDQGLSATRHWLRSSPDGQFLYALARDAQQRNQLVEIATQTGEVRFLTRNPFSIEYPFNVSSDGTRWVYLAENHVYLFDGQSSRCLTPPSAQKRVGAPHFSPDGKYVIFNEYVESSGGEPFLQIMRVATGG